MPSRKKLWTYSWKRKIPLYRRIRVAGVLCDLVRTGDYREKNFRAAERGIRAAAKAGARLICTCEQFLDGYGFDANKIREPDDPGVARCEIPERSIYIKRLAELAGELNIILVAGIALQEPSGTFNSSMVFDTTGKRIATYRKTYNQGRYAVWFAPLSGEQKRVNCPAFDIGPGKIGIKICNDRHFRETTQYMVEDGCELILCPAYGSYRPSGLTDDSSEYGIGAVFVHPKVCRFIDHGEIVFEQLKERSGRDFAIYEMEFRKPRRIA